MHPSFYKKPADIIEEEFQLHARTNYKIGTPIDPEGIRHPVWVKEAAAMNYEAWITGEEDSSE